MNSNLTREWLQQTISDIQTRRDNGSVSWDDERENILHAFEIALAAMESEPMAWTDAEELSDLKRDGYAAMLSLTRKDCEHVDPRRQILLFTHPAPVTQPEPVGWQFKSVNGDWLGLIDERGKNQAVHEGCEVREVFAMTDEFDWWSATSSRSRLDAAPLTADLQTRALVMWIKRLSLALRSASPDNKLPKAAMGYLQNNGLISIADCLRGNNEEPPA